MTNFTPEDLLMYLYKESSAEQTAAIETALEKDWTLREKTQCAQNFHATVRQNYHIAPHGSTERSQLCQGTGNGRSTVVLNRLKKMKSRNHGTFLCPSINY